MAQTPKGGLYGPLHKRHLGVVPSTPKPLYITCHHLSSTWALCHFLCLLNEGASRAVCQLTRVVRMQSPLVDTKQNR